METGSDTTQPQAGIPSSLIDADEPAVAKPAPAAEATKTEPAAAAEENAEAKVETPEQQEAKKQSRRARAREREVAARAALETENRMLRERLGQTANTQRQAPASTEPTRDQFQDYEAFIEARAEWRADQKVTQRLNEHARATQGREQQQRSQQETQKIAQEWVKREQAFQQTVEDYEEVVGPYVESEIKSLSDGARRLIVDSELGPQLLDHLARNEDVHDRIKALPPHRQIVELGKLEDKMPKLGGKIASNAPPPGKPIAQGRSTAPGYSERMSDAEYKAWRKGQGARWAQT